MDYDIFDMEPEKNPLENKKSFSKMNYFFKGMNIFAKYKDYISYFIIVLLSFLSLGIYFAILNPILFISLTAALILINKVYISLKKTKHGKS
ncbi:MAG: hypothetical protein IT243_06095 [Bacteroidia bacterium]|nr:hypothetical protein [Bacteroidia bacterium]